MVSSELSKTVIVDNSSIAYSLQQDNAIPIEAFIDDVDDDELVGLKWFLLSLTQVEDVRHVLRLKREQISDERLHTAVSPCK